MSETLVFGHLPAISGSIANPDCSKPAIDADPGKLIDAVLVAFYPMAHFIQLAEGDE